VNTALKCTQVLFVTHTVTRYYSHYKYISNFIEDQVLIPAFLNFVIRFDARAKEIELSNEGASDVRSRHRFSTTLNEFRQYNRMSFTESSSPSSPLRTPQTQDWQQNANYRRMSVKLFGTVESVAENTEEDNCPAIVAENLDDDDDNESAIHSVVTVKLQKLSYLITVYLGLSEAWRQNPFK
jgi:hypothetical protein